MLNRLDLKDYRLKSNLSYRDVARYCNMTFQNIEMIENGKRSLTKENHDEIIKGINGAKQAIANGTFIDEKTEEWQKKKEAEALKKASADNQKAKPKKKVEPKQN